MREIKFRAYDKEAERFIYSDKEYDDYFFEFKDGKLKAFDIRETSGTLDEPPGVESEEIEDPQMFTGLHDKTGREIYEGDRVRASWGFGKPPQTIESLESIFYFKGECMISDDIEVIGNKYEGEYEEA